MNYIKATKQDLEQILNIVQETILLIYPKYYPSEVVDFFSKHHCRENIERDVEAGRVGILKVENDIVGTGCYKDNHITRVYVLPKYQKQGYGSYIIQQLENEISKNYDDIFLDASLPACQLYEKRGYKTIRHDKYKVENNVVLVYEIMEKELINNKMFYDGKIFVSKENTANGEVDSQTQFEYHQRENMIWADYAGGEIIKGHLIGNITDNNELNFYYHHYNVNGQVRVGKCHSNPTILENGKIKLTENWQWMNGDKSKGKSVLIEK